MRNTVNGDLFDMEVHLFKQSGRAVEYDFVFFGLQPMTWLNNANLSIPLIIVMLTWSGFGGAVIMYLASLQGIDRSLYEAAKLDGAGDISADSCRYDAPYGGILLLQAVRQIIEFSKSQSSR